MPSWNAGTIDLLAYTDKENAVPSEWEESDPRYIEGAADVRLRSFSTKVSAEQVGTGGLGASERSEVCTPHMRRCVVGGREA